MRNTLLSIATSGISWYYSNFAKFGFADTNYICHQNEGMTIRKEKWLPLF